MIKKLYLENYKGFKKSFFPIFDINFFVGDNSTGKTAVLNLLNVLSTHTFWINFEFNNDNVELGYFNEIVHKKMKAPLFFKIGIDLTQTNDKGIKEHNYTLIKFVEKNGIATAQELKFTNGKQNIIAKIGKKEVRYMAVEFDPKCTFEDWVSQEIPFVKFQKLKNEHPVGMIRNIIEHKLSDGKGDMSFFGIIDNQIFEDFVWFEPIRAKPRRTYESYNSTFSTDGLHIPALLKKIFSSGSYKENKHIIEILEKFGKESRLFDKIKIKSLGDEKNAPFEVNILYNNIPAKLPNVGYGVSQLLPLLVQVLKTMDSTIAIQQPEVHLHPKAQAAFGEIIFNSWRLNNNVFFIETHSDFMIDRFRFCLYNQKESISKAQVVFFDRCNEGTKFTSIPIESNGKYRGEVPVEFKEFFIDEELKMLEI